MYKKIKTILLFLIFLVANFAICSGGDMERNKQIDRNLVDAQDSIYEKLSKINIYFGHQSVGENIITGINEITAENPKINLKIIETKEPSEFKTGVFAHTPIGKNEDPISKIKDFEDSVSNGIGDVADVVFLKLCFVDINAKTDIDSIFKRYNEMINRLSEKYKKVKFIHFTVPLLKREEKTIKTWIKKMIGKGGGFFSEENNIARNKYNKLILQKYSGENEIFDIARIESLRSDGKYEKFKANGKEYHALAEEYTDDGGHLNKIGRKKVAEQLLLFLARLNYTK